MSDLRNRLSQLNVLLPALSGPFGAYVPAKAVGHLVYVAGQLPMREGKLIAAGQVPSRCPVEQAKSAARQCVVNALAAVASLGDDIFNRLDGVARVGAFVNSDTTFIQQPLVANGASEFLLELFGDPGKHVRAAVGVNTLPLDAAVEVEFIFTLRDA